jgi:hypothetical protein
MEWRHGMSPTDDQRCALILRNRLTYPNCREPTSGLEPLTPAHYE